MTAVARNVFTAALGRIGIDQATRIAVAEIGFELIFDLATVQDRT
jgi:hypothetical protein